MIVAKESMNLNRGLRCSPMNMSAFPYIDLSIWEGENMQVLEKNVAKICQKILI